MGKTADRIISVLTEVSKSANGLSLAEVSKNLNIPKTTAFDIIKSLLDNNMIYINDPETTRYAIGFKAYLIGKNYENSSHLLTEARDEVDSLSERLKKTIFLSKEYERRVYCSYKKDYRDEIIRIPDVGEIVPDIFLAVKNILINYDELEIKEVFRVEKNKIEEGILAEDLVLKKYIEKLNIKFSIDLGTKANLVYSVAAPIYNFESRLVGTISLVGIYNPGYSLKNDLEELVETSKKISYKMGYRND